MINEQAIRDQLVKWIALMEGEQLLHLWRLRQRMTHDDCPVTLPPGEWIHYTIAAPLLGIGAGHLRRLCPSLSQRGLAAKATPPSGGKPTWYIARATDRAQIKVARAAR